MRAIGFGSGAMLLTLWLAGCAAAPEVAPTVAEQGDQSARASDRMPRAPGTKPPPTWSVPTVPIAGDPVLGDSAAAIAIIEFSDYQCPYCRQFHAGVFLEIKKAFIDTGIVRFYYKDFPLPGHPEAPDASIAAGCAGAQGKFWEMQQRLFEQQPSLGHALYKTLARELQLDEKRFVACLNDPTRVRAVRHDRMIGQRIGIAGTPSFIIGRIEGDEVRIERMAKGAASFEAFAREIEALRSGGSLTPP